MNIILLKLIFILLIIICLILLILLSIFIYNNIKKNKNINKNINKNTNKNTNRDINTDTNRDTNRDINRDINTNTNTDINRDINRDTNTNTNTDTNRDINTNTNRDTNNYKFNRENIDKYLSTIATEIKGTKNTPIYIIDNFLTPEECQAVIESGQDNFIKSPLTREDPNDPYFRTSKTYFFDKLEENGIQKNIKNKILKVLKINHPNSEVEAPQLQHYSIGNEFKPHYDWFDKNSDNSFYKKGQRTWTFMIYLNNVKKGGETKFININTTITPKIGRAVIWGNILSNGKEDNDTMHHGTPVIEGEKYIVTTWFKYKKNPEDL